MPSPTGKEEPASMASLTRKIAEFARSPMGRQIAARAKEYAARPENRRKIEELRARLTKRR